MKNIIYLILILSIFILYLGCVNRNDQGRERFIKENTTMQRQIEDSLKLLEYKKRHINKYQLDSIRDEYKGNYQDSLFLDFRFGMIKKEYDKVYTKLILNNILNQYSPELYAYTLKYGELRLWLVPYPTFINDKLVELKIICWNSDGSDSYDGVMYHLNDQFSNMFYDDDNTYWFKSGLEIQLCKELVNNDPYPETKTGVLYLKYIK
ncbi:MAG: hypothetical protein KH100_15255 [Dysgonomonas mossii]|uniref:hypothetical protein n=1 Tax=Dysgonomonas mossii TaxID=163665 RepID=UPI001D624436|nr:hypothetical protein [Dysgonomonas mossii]MBS7112540.1 hypothetical protein [Dysgonomonas mossii]